VAWRPVLMFLVMFPLLGCPREPEIHAVLDDAGTEATMPIAAAGDGGAAPGSPAPASPAPAAPSAEGCTGATRRCPDGSCRPNDVKACGAACQACAAPAGAVATCDGKQCALSCPKDFLACDNQCVSRLVPSCCDQDATLDADASGAPDCKENLISNGQFTRDLGPWSNGFAGNGETKWTAMDSAGRPDSGSLSVTTTAPTLSYSAAAVMAVNLPGGIYNVSVDYFIPFGQTNGGQAVLEVATQDPEVGNQVIPLGSKTGAWVKVSTFVTLDPRVKQRTLFLEAQRGQAVTPFAVYYDNLVLRPLMYDGAGSQP
jgi:hypothetical protein